jgi:hypothetical protein
MNKAEFKGLKGAGITILWLVEKTDKPFRKSDFLGVYNDRTIASAFECLEGAGLIVQFQDEYYKLAEEYSLVVNPTFTTTAYINNIVSLKGVKSIKQWSEKVRAVYDLLRAFGIGRSVAAELCELQHATLEYVTAHIEQAKKEGIAKGLFVTRIRDNDPMPESDDYDPDRYTSGTYSDFIES